MGPLSGPSEQGQGKGLKVCCIFEKHKLLTALCILVFSAALTLGLHNESTYRTGSWDPYSEMLVFGRMLQMQQNQSAPGGFLGVYTEEWGGDENRAMYRDNTPVRPEEYRSYTHQSGLQGWAWGVANKLLSVFADDGLSRERTLYFINSMLFYAATLCVCLALWNACGLPAAAGWLAAALLAPGLQAGMKNLYWCLWLWLVPLLAGIVLCRATVRRGRTPAWCLALVFSACLARALCGFEFISTYLILCEAPLVWHWAADGALQRKSWFWRMVSTGAAAVGGVAAALAVWLAQGRLYYGNWAESLANITGAASSRMSVSDGAVREGITPLGVLAGYLRSDAAMLRLGEAAVTLRGLLAFTLASLAGSALLWALLRQKARLAALGPAALVWMLTFAAPASWIVLSKAHADIHTWLIEVLWQFAFVPGCCALLGYLLSGWGCVLRGLAKTAQT